MSKSQMFARAKAAYKVWLDSDKTDILKAYNKPSIAKLSAWEFCKQQVKRYGGYGLRVVYNNCWIFTCGFCYRDEDTNQRYFVYITPNYETIVEVEDEPCNS